MNKLLTIGIPTFNRSKSLAVMLTNFSNQITPYHDFVEIIISDNCSSDNTPQIIQNWLQNQPKELQIKTVRHAENIGGSNNIISLLYASTSQYFMFLGDDDSLCIQNFPKILDLLLNKKPSAIIQTQWSNKSFSIKEGSVNFEDALPLFYEYGNAWAGIIDRDAAINAINSRSLHNELKTNVWAQTIFGYLAMYDLSSSRNIELVNFKIGDVLVESMNITNKTYWRRCFNDLLLAADTIQVHTKSTSIRRHFTGISISSCYVFVKTLFWHSIIDDDALSLISIQRLLKQRFGWRGRLWSIILSFDRCRPLLMIMYNVKQAASNMNFKVLFRSNIQKIRSNRKDEQLNNTEKRFGVWFD